MSAHKPPTILFVDDDHDSRETTAWLLRQAGFAVLEAGSGGEALHLAGRQPDLILLDVHLPDLDGFEVCRRLKDSPATASVPVLHISGVSATSHDRAHGLDSGADAYLTKPVEPGELIAHIKALLRVRQAEELARASAERLSLVLDTAYDAFVATDAGGVLIDWNCRAEGLFGWKREEALGRRLVDLIIPPRYRERHQLGLAEMLRAGEQPPLRTSLEVTALHQSGHEFPAELMVSLLRWRGVPLFSAFVRDLTARKRAERYQAVQHAVSAVLAESPGLGEATRRILQAVCDITGWDAGAVWQVDPRANVLRCVESWVGPGLDAERFADLTKRQTFAPGDGLPGRVWSGRQPASVPDLARESDLPRAEAACRAGLHGAFACPVHFGLEVTGVIEFFSRSVRPPDDLLAILGTPSSQIGQFLERKRVEEARAEQAALAAFNADVAAALTRPGGLTDGLQRCAEAMVRHLGAAFARIWTLNEQTDVLELQASAGLYTHLNGPHSRIPVGRWKVGRIAQERRPYRTDDAANDPRTSDPEWARREGMVAFAGHPLVSGGRLLGVLGLFARRPLSDFALQALASSADNIASGIQRKLAERTLRATEAEFRVAQRVQQHLFPRTPPALPGFDIDGRSYPAEATGGDYYDFIPLGGEALGVAIGDVSGHGLGPALLMASTRASLRALALVHEEVGEVFAGVNRILTGDTQDEFVTLFLARLEPRSGSFTYVSAGHVAGYVLDAEGRVKRCLESTAMPLGVLPEAPFPSSPAITLDPGDLVLLLTDGVTDARCPDETSFGAERALAVARLYRRDPARRVVENVYGAVRAFMQDMPQFDDVSLVVIKREAPGGA